MKSFYIFHKFTIFGTQNFFTNIQVPFIISLDNKEIKILTYSPWTICVNILVDYTYGSAIDRSKVKIFELLIGNNKVP